MLVCRVSYSTVFSLSWMQPLDWLSLSGSMIIIMSLCFCAIYTGCVHSGEFNTVWRCWRSVVNMEWLHRTGHRSSGRQRQHWSNSAAGADDETLNNRRPCVSSCGRMHVEQACRWLLPVMVAVYFQRKTEKGTLSALLSRHLIVLLFCRCWCCVFIFHFFCIVTL